MLCKIPLKDVRIIEVNYCYPSSPRASYFGVEKAGCYFITVNHNVHDGPFDTLNAAHDFADVQYKGIKHGQYSMPRREIKNGSN